MDCVMAELSDVFAAVYSVVRLVAWKDFGKMVAVKGGMKVSWQVYEMVVLKVEIWDTLTAIKSAF